MEDPISYRFAPVRQQRENRHEIDYQLSLRQQPKQSRMCGVGEKADRRPIDPPPIVQLRVFNPNLGPADKNAYLQNPYYFMYASLMAAELDEELHLLRDGKTRSTTGSVVSSLYNLKDIDNTEAGFFVFPDLSVRLEGSYRLKLSLFEVIGKEVFHCKSIISDVFVVFSAKKFPGMEESTLLSRSFADQGLKIRIRKELRLRKLSYRRGRMDEKMTEEIDADNQEKRARVIGPTVSIPVAETIGNTLEPVQTPKDGPVEAVTSQLHGEPLFLHHADTLSRHRHYTQLHTSSSGLGPYTVPSPHYSPLPSNSMRMYERADGRSWMPVSRYTNEASDKNTSQSGEAYMGHHSSSSSVYHNGAIDEEQGMLPRLAYAVPVHATQQHPILQDNSSSTGSAHHPQLDMTSRYTFDQYQEPSIYSSDRAPMPMAPRSAIAWPQFVPLNAQADPDSRQTSSKVHFGDSYDL